MNTSSNNYLTENETLISELKSRELSAETYADLLMYELKCILSAFAVCDQTLSLLVRYDHPSLPREDDLVSLFKRMYGVQKKIVKTLRKYTSFARLDDSIPLFEALRDNDLKISHIESELIQLQECRRISEERYIQKKAEADELIMLIEEYKKKIGAMEVNNKKLEEQVSNLYTRSKDL